MEIIFWQGIISIHQKTFLEALALQPAVSSVIMVVEQDITPYRKNMGWEVPEIKNVTVIVAPTHEKIKEIFGGHHGALHMLGGIRPGRMMTVALEEGIRQKARMGLMSEPYNRNGLKGKLRDLKYFSYKLRYFGYFDFVLAIGKEGVNTFRRLGFKPDRIFPWGYFITVEAGTPKQTNDDVRIVYAGRIEPGKGIARFVAELAKHKNARYRLDIYGSGVEEEALKTFVQENKLSERVQFFPFLKYDELIKQYANYNWVVLPSTQKDGWGVIISEGLLNGLKAICSNICGVSWAVKDKFNGVVFDWSKDGSCAEAIDAMLHDHSFADTETIRQWAERSLSGEAGAQYFLKVTDCVYNGKNVPAIPWEI